MISFEKKILSFQEFYDFRKRNNHCNITHDRFEWLYHNNPFGKASFYCAHDGEKLIGTEILIPLEMSLKGNTFMTSQAVGSFIDPGYRGQGLWKKLLIASAEDSKNCGIKVIWGPPNENSLPILIHHSNWEFVCDISTMRYLCGVNHNRKVPIRLTQFLLLGFNNLRKFKNRNLESVTFSTHHITENDSLVVNKNPGYLKWRYQENPERVYNLQSLINSSTGEIQGFWVSCIFGRTLHVVDYQLTNDTQYFNDFVGLIQQAGFENDCYRIILRENIRSIKFSIFKKSGFMKLAQYKVYANILDDDYRDIFITNIWDLKMGDEDINFTQGTT